MRIGVIGSGYVGLVSGVCLASRGIEVICFDLNEKVVATLNSGIPHIYEEDLEKLLQSCLQEKKFSSQIVDIPSLAQCDVIMLAVGTPSTDGKINLSQIASASEIAGKAIALSKKKISVIVKSTVLPGTTDTFVRDILEQSSGKKLGEFGLGMNPEFLREGNAVSDFMNPDRIVFGFENDIAKDHLHQIYQSWHVEKIEVNTRTAETIKYANNYVLATLISTANEIANFCYTKGNIDSDLVIKGVYADKRWSPILKDGSRIRPEILTYLYPGCGFGGSCFPKDVQAFRSAMSEVGLQPHIAQAVLDVNESQPEKVIEVLSSSNTRIQNARVLVLGLSFKPGTDDVRESPSAKFIEHLQKENCMITAHDPIAGENFKKSFPNLKVTLVQNWQEQLSSHDIIIVATRWPEYGQLSDTKLQLNLSGKTLVDLRRMFTPHTFSKVHYLSIGYRNLENKKELSHAT